MSSPEQTDSLVGALARQAGSLSLPNPGLFRTLLAAAALISLAVSVVLVVLLIGFRPEFTSAAHRSALVYKLVSMVLLSVAGVILAGRASLPASGRLSAALLLPGLIVLAFRAATDESGISVMGSSIIAVPGCLLIILAASILPLAILLHVMRIGAPTRPTLAGAIVGMLSGALGATAYAFACRNDGGMFVAVWYIVAILVMAAGGAAIGRRFLSW